MVLNLYFFSLQYTALSTHTGCIKVYNFTEKYNNYYLSKSQHSLDVQSMEFSNPTEQINIEKVSMCLFSYMEKLLWFTAS